MSDLKINLPFLLGSKEMTLVEEKLSKQHQSNQ